MLQRPDIDYKLREALANEEHIDVSGIPDICVMALPLEVKWSCLRMSQMLQDHGIDDDPVVRLKRCVKVRDSLQALDGQEQGDI